MEEDPRPSTFPGQDPYAGDVASPSINTPELDGFLGSDMVPSRQAGSGTNFIDPLNDPWLLECFDPASNVSGLRDPGEGTSQRGGIGSGGSGGDDFGCPRPLYTWPPPAVPYNCTCCQVLREIVHTNGIHTMKFEIHGRIGLISHGILENYFYGSDARQRQMFDFGQESLDGVKNFLKNYFEERRLAGYTLLPDMLAVFYGAVCVGLDGSNKQPAGPSSCEFAGDYINNPRISEHQNQAYPSSADTLAGPPVSNRQAEGRYTSTSPPATRILGESSAAAENAPTNVNDPDFSADVVNSMGNGSRAEESNGTSRALVLIEQPDGDIAPLNPSGAAAGNAPRRRRSYAEQRARAKNLTWDEMSSCFHLRLKDAAKSLDFCETTVKKRLHELIKRWPYRTVNKLRKEMSVWTNRLNSADEREKQIARAEIRRLQQELDDIYSGKTTGRF